MRVLLHGLWTRDPFGGLMLFAAYGAINGVVLLLQADAFDRNPIYTFLRDVPLPEWAWGVAMLATAAGLLAAARWPLPALGPILLLLIAAFWGGFGVLIALGSYAAGILSAASFFNVAGAVMCVMAASQPAPQEVR